MPGVALVNEISSPLGARMQFYCKVKFSKN
jgi:hypothetical protein